MQEIKYYPLIDCDSAGKEKTPLFFSDDEATVRQSHKMYLQEIIPQFYRLCSVNVYQPQVRKPIPSTAHYVGKV